MYDISEQDEQGWALHALNGRTLDHYAGGKPAECPKCAGTSSDNRTEGGHLTLDPRTGATVLEPHQRTAADADIERRVRSVVEDVARNLPWAPLDIVGAIAYRVIVNQLAEEAR